MFFYACQESANITNPETSLSKIILPSEVPPTSYCGDEEVVTLWAGQTIDVGTVTVGNDDEFLYLTYAVTGDWLIKKVHLDYGPVPFTEKGEPGKYAYSSGDLDPFVTSFTFKIALADLMVKVDDQICFRAHADVTKPDGLGGYINQTAMGGTITKPHRGAWYGTFCYTVQECEEVKCFAYTCDTGFGGITAGLGSAWWFYYDVSVGGEQTIWAGQNKNAGTVQYTDGQIVITLAEGWSLKEYNMDICGVPKLDENGNPIPYTEPVKIQGYEVIPESRPIAGQFKTYKGTSLTQTVDSFPYFVIHLDLVKTTEVPCP